MYIILVVIAIFSCFNLFSADSTPLKKRTGEKRASAEVSPLSSSSSSASSSSSTSVSAKPFPFKKGSSLPIFFEKSSDQDKKTKEKTSEKHDQKKVRFDVSEKPPLQKSQSNVSSQSDFQRKLSEYKKKKHKKRPPLPSVYEEMEIPSHVSTAHELPYEITTTSLTSSRIPAKSLKKSKSAHPSLGKLSEITPNQPPSSMKVLSPEAKEFIRIVRNFSKKERHIIYFLSDRIPIESEIAEREGDDGRKEKLITLQKYMYKCIFESVVDDFIKRKKVEMNQLIAERVYLDRDICDEHEHHKRWRLVKRGTDWDVQCLHLIVFKEGKIPFEQYSQYPFCTVFLHTESGSFLPETIYIKKRSKQGNYSPLDDEEDKYRIDEIPYPKIRYDDGESKYIYITQKMFPVLAEYPLALPITSEKFGVLDYKLIPDRSRTYEEKQ